MTGFNAAQLKAIEHKDGPMIVVAGPGSGKTTVLTHRIAHLIDACHVQPGSILVITFTRAAAQEMEYRFRRLNGSHDGRSPVRKDGPDVCFGTFHSFFLKILQEYASGQGRRGKYRIAEPKEALSALRRAAEKNDRSAADTSDYYDYVLHQIGRIKNGLECSDPKISKLRYLYDDEMSRRGLIDFDDMLVRCLELIKKEPAVLEGLRMRFRYIMVDEFQDINPVQFEILQLISGPRNNLFVVGDDDQSIYAFRGSDPSIMLSFKTYYPDSAFLRLTENYRSSRSIVRASAKLIRHNKRRYSKRLTAARDRGSRPVFRQYADPWEEAAAVLEDISGLPDGKDAAVLYRTHKAGSEIGRMYSEVMDDAAESGAGHDRRHGKEPIALRKALRGKKIHLMTFHAAKGLEFDTVYIIRAEEEITPGKAKDPRDKERYFEHIEEERRIFYVAMTRAKDHLQISCVRSRQGRKCRRSRFMREAAGLLGGGII